MEKDMIKAAKIYRKKEAPARGETQRGEKGSSYFVRRF
jgi:hypothetical protein